LGLGSDDEKALNGRHCTTPQNIGEATQILPWPEFGLGQVPFLAYRPVSFEKEKVTPHLLQLIYFTPRQPIKVGI
jgi:hypothetical protein